MTQTLGFPCLAAAAFCASIACFGRLENSPAGLRYFRPLFLRFAKRSNKISLLINPIDVKNVTSHFSEFRIGCEMDRKNNMIPQLKYCG